MGRNSTELYRQVRERSGHDLVTFKVTFDPIIADTTLTFEIELTDLLEDPFRAFDMMDPFASIAT